MKPSGNRGFAPPGRTALRSRQNTSPRQSRRFFHIRSSPSQMAQAALLYPYYSSFPGDCNGRRQGIQADAAGSFRARVNHHSPQAAMPSGNCLTQRQDLWKIPTLILTNCFTLSVQEIPSTTKRLRRKSLRSLFLSLFFCFWLRESGGTQTARLLSPNGTRLHTSGRSTGWTGFPGHAPPSGRQESPPHQTAPPCRTG